MAARTKAKLRTVEPVTFNENDVLEQFPELPEFRWSVAELFV